MIVSIRAYAKVNLTLEVVARRADGYHEIRSVVQRIALHDQLRFERAARWSVAIFGTPEPIEDDLICRAGRTLERATGLALPTAVRCEKRVPVGAGLGGGSSDAAATLLALRRLWSLPLSRARLCEMGAELGSDVPLFLEGGTSLLAGRGTEVGSAPPLQPCWVVLAVPSSSASEKTRSMYARLRPEHFTSGQRTESLLDRLRSGAGRPVAELWNVFDTVADDVFPGLSALRESLSLASGSPFRLSGAGPALYALLPDLAAAKRCLAAVGGCPATLILTRTLAGKLRPWTEP